MRQRKIVNLAQCGALQYFGHLVGHKASRYHQIYLFLFQNGKTIASAHLPNAMLACVCTGATIQFSKMTDLYF